MPLDDDDLSALGGKLADLAFLSRALSDENRLRILVYLDSGQKSVSQIVEDMNLSQPLVSHHLRELKRALLVQIERRGPFVYYELSRLDIIEVLKAMNRLAESLISERKSF